MSSGGAQAPISLFYSYSHKDEHWRLKLKNHLAFLVHSGIISEWTDRDIDVGQEWEKEIDQNLSSADIILLLVSANFIASKYCWSVEVKKALERHDRGEAKVIPVILRPCHWTSTPFAKLQAAPKDAKPVLRWADADEAFCDVVSKIEHVVTDLQRKRAAAETPAPIAPTPPSSAPSSPNPGSLPHAGEGDHAAAGTARPPAGEGGIRVSGMVRAGSERATPKVFISYSHDSDAHKARVLAFADRLRNKGLAVMIDQYVQFPPEGWPLWCEKQIDEADFVLMVCTEVYLRRVRDEEMPGTGRGVLWEAQLIRQELYDSGSVSVKFVPVRFADGSDAHIPRPVRRFSRYIVDLEAGHEALYRYLTDQPATPPPRIGEREVLPPAPRPGLADAQRGEWPPGTVFRDVDAPWCPEMVALPAGDFLMGSAQEEKERYKDEGPRHRVTIGHRFAIGRYPVTFREYDHFCAKTGWERPLDMGWGRGRRPVINVRWRDAWAYIEWLAEATGKPYQLPSEAEWEYACRAGTTTRYAFGDEITARDANYGESQLGKTGEVGGYPANHWGLYDMHGNVWEVVADVWHNSYKGAPTDGSPWTDGEEQNSSRIRVNRGGSWYNGPWDCRSARRIRNGPNDPGSIQGFRVARTLD